MSELEIGRLLRAGISGFVAGIKVAEFERHAPSFGALLRAPLGEDQAIYGLIYDIHIDDDQLIRQLVTADEVADATIADNRLNRTVPVELSVLAVGYRQKDVIHHLLPPRPALSLDAVTLCAPEEIVEFTSVGFGYLRHLLRDPDLPIAELLAAHVGQAAEANRAAGNTEWGSEAAKELITLLRDDYQTLMDVLSSLGNALPEPGEQA